MLLFSLSLAFAVAGMLTADPESKIKECMEGIDFKQLEELIEAPDGNEMEIICPRLLPALKCVDDTLEEEIGLRMADLARMVPDEDIGKAAALFVNLQGLLEDLCDETSELHKTYIRHADCFQSIPSSKLEECVRESAASYDAYKAFDNKIEEAGDQSREDNSDCLVKALSSACLAAEIYDTCGMGAFEIYQTVVKRTNVFRLALCSQADLIELKSDFLDSLNLEDERKDLFRLAFDLRKRRK